jgi:MFS family permease
MHKSSSEREYRVYFRRWWILVIFMLMIVSNATLWVTFAPISDIAEDYFGDAGSTTRVNMLAIIFLISYPLGTLIEVKCMQLWKLRGTILVGGCFSFLGSLFRVLAAYIQSEEGNNTSTVYFVMLFGQFLAALAQPLFMNCPASISASWFPPEERDISTALGSLSSPLGNAIGSVLPILFVYPSNTLQENIIGMRSLMLVEMGVCFLPLLLCFLYFEGSPPSAPSYSAFLKNDKAVLQKDSVRTKSQINPSSSNNHHHHHQSGSPPSESSGQGLDLCNGNVNDNNRSSYDENNNNDDDDDYELEENKAHDLVELTSNHSVNRWGSTVDQLKYLYENKNYCLLYLCFTIGLGLFTAIMTLINQIVQPYGYSNDDAGTFAAVLLACGLLGAAVSSKLLEQTKAYETVLKAGFILCSISIVFLVSTFKPDNLTIVTLAFATTGFALLPMLPATIENTAECTYPDVTEDLSVGLLFMGGNIVGVVMCTVLQSLLESEAKYYSKDTNVSPLWRGSNIFMMLSLLVATSLLMLYKGDYRRMQADQGAAAEYNTHGSRSSSIDHADTDTNSNSNSNNSKIINRSNNNNNRPGDDLTNSLIGHDYMKNNQGNNLKSGNGNVNVRASASISANAIGSKDVSISHAFSQRETINKGYINGYAAEALHGAAYNGNG